MDGISVYSEEARTTWVPNEFIDYYMPRANGTFVKVYLYLLRCLTSPEAGFGISAIADALEETEKDILRALRYWERENVLRLSWKNDNTELSGIKLLRLTKPSDKEQASGFISAEESFSGSSTGTSAVLPSSPIGRSETVTRLSSVTVADGSEFAVSTENTKPSGSAAKPSVSSSKLPSYTLEQLDAFSSESDSSWLLHVLGQYLERMLNQTDLQLVLFFHDELHFSNDLILYLYEYCVSRGKTAPSYIQKVGISWHQNGIDTVEKAENASFQFDSAFLAVNRAFALNRMPGIAERRFIDRWNALGLSAELIEEACNRTMLNISRPDFKYANKILEEWHKKEAHTLADVEALDKEHKVQPPEKPKNNAHTANPNRFNAFPQRDYSKTEMNELEKILLSKNQKKPN